MCQTGLIILCRNKTSAGSKVFFHQLLLLGIVCLAAFVRRKGKIQSLFLKLILKLTYLLFCVSAAISALWFLSRGPRELKLSTCALHTASSAPPQRPTSLVPTSSVSVIIGPASSPVFMASVPVQFHPWPYSVHNHHWSCPASHLCCSGPARLSLSSLIMSRLLPYTSTGLMLPWRWSLLPTQGPPITAVSQKALDHASKHTDLLSVMLSLSFVTQTAPYTTWNLVCYRWHRDTQNRFWRQYCHDPNYDSECDDVVDNCFDTSV